ncbi:MULTISPECIES: hypothetical protein [unclassified Campylobacter]|uniref:hypothetical protein n=1 Tax=unclassified Campylobacter TaxID=2593542 RepID=UPI0022E9D7A3|nr:MULTISPECIES: hypothetical protein [unclassified Campylobacter]MDA3061751.1 hypothetical protein [Campylobacter sp. JMF_14 EL1]MDA3073143.1 hypothetical protein [Campylobacter sp. JMF_10 EL2]
MINEKVRNFLLSSVGFDGGDLGSPKRQSIWLCGIEWGLGYNNIEDLKNTLCNYIPLKNIIENNKNFFAGIEDLYDNIKYPYNRNAIKILSHMLDYNGDYKKFNNDFKPFGKNEIGFFKMNLLPISFPNTRDFDKRNKTAQAIGFKDYNHYIEECHKRFKLLKELKEKYQPKIIICTGKTFDKFKIAFGIKNDDIKHYDGEKNSDFDCAISEYKNGKKCLFVQTRFIVFPHLCSNIGLKNCGENIRKIAQKNDIELP